MFEQLGLGFKFPTHVHFIKPISHGLPSLPPSWGKPLLGVLSCFCPKMATVLENKLLFGILECGCWPHKQVTTLAEVFAGDKRSLQSLGCYYPCVACMYPAFVWTSAKNVWNAQHALRWQVFGPSITNLIAYVLTICHMKLAKAQCWSKSVLTCDCCCPHCVTVGFC